MFDGFSEWRANATSAMARYIALREQIEALETESATVLADVLDAYAWPESVPEPELRDQFGVEHVGGRAFGEDMTGELALANRMSLAGAFHLVADMITLTSRLPGCWGKVASGEATLRQARRVASETESFVPEDGWGKVDGMIAPVLGAVNATRLNKMISAAIKTVNPEHAKILTDSRPRHVWTGVDKGDPLTGWLSARLDTKDALSLESTIQMLAERLAADGDDTDRDTRRAKALGLLADPANVMTMVGDTSTSSSVFTPKTQVYVHMHLDNLDDWENLARVELLGPVLISQVSSITKGSKVRLTPVIHCGDIGAVVDSYEIPDCIRRQVLAGNPYDVFPWASTPSRNLDLDHTIPYKPGQPGQTRPDNLGPLSRKAHRIKTHCDWYLRQPEIGVYIWESAAGQKIQVDPTGTHPIRPDP